MKTYARNGNKWTINEILSLQREYELLKWSIQQIASKHQRSINSILYKLENENFISSWNDARGFEKSYLHKLSKGSSTWKSISCDLNDDESIESFDDENDDDYEEEEEDEDDYEEDEQDDEDEEEDDNYDNQLIKLNERVSTLETSFNDMNIMVKQLLDSLVDKKTKQKNVVSCLF
jgi:hypothetical protein